VTESGNVRKICSRRESVHKTETSLHRIQKENELRIRWLVKASKCPHIFNLAIGSSAMSITSMLWTFTEGLLVATLHEFV
jgi:hypothetical protein